MKASKIVGVVGGSLFSLVGVTAAVVYFGWLSPPSPDAVCDNVARIHKKELGSEMSGKDRAKCTEEATTPPQFGRAIWVKQLKCMRDATSATELVACEKESPL